MQFKDNARSQRHADTLKRLGLDPVARQAEKSAEAENSPSQLPSPAGLRNLDDWRRALGPGVVTDDGSAKPGDQIHSIDDFRRIGDQLTGGALTDADAAKLTGNDWKILKGLLPSEQQPDATIAINRDDTPWQQKIRPIGRHVPDESSNGSRQLAHLGDTLAADGVYPGKGVLPDFSDEPVDESDAEEPTVAEPSPAPDDDIRIDPDAIAVEPIEAEPDDLHDIREVLPPSFGPSDPDTDNIREVRPAWADDPNAPEPLTDYQKQYPLGERRKAEGALAEAIPNWGQLDARTRDAIVHLAVDVGVKHIIANDSLVTALSTNNHAAMADSLKALEGLMTAEQFEKYAAGPQIMAGEDEEKPKERPQLDRIMPPTRPLDWKRNLGKRSRPGQTKYPAPGQSPSGYDDSGVIRPSEPPAHLPKFRLGEGDYNRDPDYDVVYKQLHGQKGDKGDEGWTDVVDESDGTPSIGGGIDLSVKNRDSLVATMVKALGIREKEAREKIAKWMTKDANGNYVNTIDKDEATRIQRQFIKDAEEEVLAARRPDGSPWMDPKTWNQLPGQAKELIIELHYQTGRTGLGRYVKFGDALKEGDFIKAGWEIWNSQQGLNYDPERGLGGLQTRCIKQTYTMQRLDPRYGETATTMERDNQ